MGAAQHNTLARLKRPIFFCSTRRSRLSGCTALDWDGGKNMCIQNFQRLSSFSLHCWIWWILFCHHCPVSSAGGLSCKHLSKGDSSSLSFSKALNPRPVAISGGFFHTLPRHLPQCPHLLFPPPHHSLTRTDLFWPLTAVPWTPPVAYWLLKATGGEGKNLLTC